MVSPCRHLTLPLLAGLALGALVLLLPPPAEACMTIDCSECCDGCRSCTCDGSSCFCEGGLEEFDSLRNEARSVEVIFTGPRTVSMVIPHYSTTKLRPTTHCVTALPPIPGVDTVDNVVNYDGRTGLPFEEVTFFSAPGPGEAIAKLAAQEGVAPEEDGAWHAFQSHITGTVRDGVPNFFVVEMTLERGVTQAQFVKTLKRKGLFLTSSSDADGVPTPGHTAFRRIGAEHVVVTGMQLEVPEPSRTAKAPRQP